MGLRKQRTCHILSKKEGSLFRRKDLHKRWISIFITNICEDFVSKESILNLLHWFIVLWPRVSFGNDIIRFRYSPSCNKRFYFIIWFFVSIKWKLMMIGFQQKVFKARKVFWKVVNISSEIRSILNANLLYLDFLFSLHHVLSIYIIFQTLIHTNIILECLVVSNKNQK